MILPFVYFQFSGREWKDAQWKTWKETHENENHNESVKHKDTTKNW